MTATDDREIAIVSVSDKTGLAELVHALVERHNYEVYASDGSLAYLMNSGIPENLFPHLKSVSLLTNFPAMLGGRVKTLHPGVLGPVLARETDSQELSKYGWKPVSTVICNLYPFEEHYGKLDATKRDVLAIEDEMIELIDIGGVTLLRAAAKNWKNVTVLSRPSDYGKYLQLLSSSSSSFSSSYDGGNADTNVDESALKTSFQREMALKAFQCTSHYDKVISEYLMECSGCFSLNQDSGMESLDVSYQRLKYGINPHQFPAFVKSIDASPLPFQILAGNPGYINILDAMHAYPLVSELKSVLPDDRLVAASFKHCSPAGVSANCSEFTSEEIIAFHLNPSIKYSPITRAYIRSRGSDPLSSFGDFVAVSGTVDLSLANYLAGYVSDGIIAPDYTEEALAKLSEKKKGSFLVMKWIGSSGGGNKRYLQDRDIQGVTLCQPRNEFILSKEMIDSKDERDEVAIVNAIVAAMTLKYTQSNSLCMVHEGTAIAVGSGMQSRLHCTKVVVQKAQRWWLRFHPMVSESLHFKAGVKKAEKINAIENYLTLDRTLLENNSEWLSCFQETPNRFLSKAEKASWISTLQGCLFGSDAFFPFPDSLEHVLREMPGSVNTILSPTGSKNDILTQKLAEANGIDFIACPTRLFTH